MAQAHEHVDIHGKMRIIFFNKYVGHADKINQKKETTAKTSQAKKEENLNAMEIEEEKIPTQEFRANKNPGEFYKNVQQQNLNIGPLGKNPWEKKLKCFRANSTNSESIIQCFERREYPDKLRI